MFRAKPWSGRPLRATATYRGQRVSGNRDPAGAREDRSARRARFGPAVVGGSARRGCGRGTSGSGRCAAGSRAGRSSFFARSRAKNEIHAVLMRCLKDRPPASDLFGVKGRRWLAEQQLSLTERETVDSAVRQVDFLDAEIAAVERLIATEALSWPEVKRLMTVPGVNVIVAATFMAAVGDIRRFPDRRKLTAYLGLDPRVRQSGAGPATHGHISKQGSSSARHALVEACWSTVRQPGPIAGFYQRIKARRGHSIAIVASARKLACLFWCLLTPRRGLRLRAAVADEEEDAPPRAAGRRRALPGRPRRLVDQRRDAPSRTRARAAGPARLRTHHPRPPTDRRARARHRAAHQMAPQGASRAADHKAPGLRFDSSSPAPTRTLPRQAAIEQADLTFIRRRPGADGVGWMRPKERRRARWLRVGPGADGSWRGRSAGRGIAGRCP